MLSAIGTQLLALIEQIGYLGITVAMFLENLFPPIPSELIMPFGGFLAGQDKLSLWGVIGAGVLGTYLGVLPFYLLGYRLHKPKLLQITKRRGGYIGLSVEEIESAFDAFHNRGPSFVFFGRFIPLFRTIISFPAGAARMHFGRYSLYTLAGSLIRCSLLAIIGYLLGDQWERVGVIMKQYEHIILIGIVVCLARFFGPKLRKKIK